MKIIFCQMLAFGIVVWSGLSAHASEPDSPLDGVLNAAYTIEKTKVQLNSGRSEVQAAPGSAIRITTAVFGDPIFGDLNGDGRDDAALILVQEPGGSGAFYYVAAAIAEDGNYQGTNAVFLGDRVAPRSVQIRNGVIKINYADRRPGELMVTPPSIAKTMCLRLEAGTLKAIKAP